MNRIIFVLFASMMGFSSGAETRAETPGGIGKLMLNVGTVDTASLPNLKANPSATFEAGRRYVIQLDGPVTAERHAALRKAGIVLHEYLPNDAYVADLSATSPDRIAELGFIIWVGEFREAWKLDPELGRRTFMTAERQDLAQRGRSLILITLFEGREPTEVSKALAALPESSVHFAQDEGGILVISATIRTADVAGLARLPDVHYVEEGSEITLRNATSCWIVQSNITNVTPIWAHGITGAGQVVGHMDGKINMSHCAFFDPVNNTPSPTHRKVVAYNESLGYNQHGTHTADTAAGDDYQGSTGNLRGMAYDAKIVHSPTPSLSETGFYNAATTQYGQGARAFTNSWGNDGTTSYDGLCRGVDRFSYDNEEALVMFAVTNQSNLRNPENAKDLIAVGASQDTPSQDSLCYGGFGPTVDGRRKPEIFAPGCNTTSASGSGTSCNTAGLSGTSMACPVITGNALLVRQYYMDGWYPSGAANASNAFTPSGALVKATLLNATVDMTGIVGYPSNQEGFGRLLLDNALYFVGDARKLVVPADIRNAAGLSTGQMQEYPFNVLSSSQQLKITLVWTEPAASASTGSGNAVVNDLDLEVVNPVGTLYLGNVYSGGVSVTGGTKDAKNNVEMVILNSPPTGSWQVRVRAGAVSVGLQGYSIAITGDCSATPVCATSRGDLSGNTGVNGADISGFVSCYLTGTSNTAGCACADMDANVVLDGNDLTSFVNCLLGLGCP